MSRRLPKPFTPTELERIEAAADDETWAVCELLRETGLRSAELRSITTQTARAWKRPPWWCRRGGCRRHSAVTKIIGKGDKERVIVLTPAAIRAAHRLLPSANGQLVRFSERGLRWKLEQVSAASGVHVHAHRFRHTAITELVEAGAPIDVVADIAGHSKIDTTRVYYEASVARRLEAQGRRRRR